MLTLFYQTAAGAEAIAVDASVSETHGGAVAIPTHPVEKGADVSDHVRRELASLRIEGLLTDHPLKSAGSGEATTVFGADPGPGRAVYLYAQLEALRDAGTLFEVHTGLRVYERMLIQDLQSTRDRSIAGAVRFTATMREIRIVESGTVAIRAVVPRAKPKVDTGPQTGTPASDAEKRKSVLLNVAEKVSNALGKVSP